MTNFTFTTRETYVQWRAEWRRQYAELSAKIREQKLAFKHQQREYDYLSSVITPATYWRALADLTKSQKTAKVMLAQRELSKLEAAKQRELRINGGA